MPRSCRSQEKEAIGEGEVGPVTQRLREALLATIERETS